MHALSSSEDQDQPPRESMFKAIGAFASMILAAVGRLYLPNGQYMS